MNNPEAPRKIWFPAKTYGWGWGPPVCWQGWLVLALYVAALAAGARVIFFRDPKAAPFFVVYAIIVTVLLSFICWWKGETPGWRWGDKPRDSK